MSLACYYDYLVSLNLITVLTVVYCHRLKINHDSQEFILESGTVANINNHTVYADAIHPHAVHAHAVHPHALHAHPVHPYAVHAHAVHPHAVHANAVHPHAAHAYAEHAYPEQTFCNKLAKCRYRRLLT